MDTDVPPILLPCAICARTFMPQSLEKHSRICERTAARKRRVFDSAKQRIQGTELQGFRSRQEKKRQNEKASRSSASWKQNHDEFLRAIRAARCEVVSPLSCALLWFFRDFLFLYKSRSTWNTIGDGTSKFLSSNIGKSEGNTVLQVVTCRDRKLQWIGLILL